MKNTLGDLNNHLFAELERLSDEDLKGSALQEELDRAKGVATIANKIIANGNLILNAQKLTNNANNTNIDITLPKMLEG